MFKIAPFIFSGLVFSSSNIAMAADSNAIIKAVTVLIATTNSNGSGVIIKRAGNKYTVLTAAHVVRSTQQVYSIGTADGQKYQISNPKFFPQGIDLAVIDFTSSKSYPVAKVGNSDNSEEGSSALVAGYPRSDRELPIYNLRKGRVVANSSTGFDEGYGIVYSSNTLPGMSGGGVFNDLGELIAIHGKGDVTSGASLGNANSSPVRLKTGYDLGIPINTFIKSSPSVAGFTIAQAPTNPRDRPRAGEAFLQGLNLYRIKKYPEAINAFSSAIQRDPQDAVTHYYRGLSQFNSRNFSAAFSDFDQSIKLNPQDAFPYMFRAFVFLETKQIDKAEADLNRSIQLDSKNSYPYLFRGILNARPERNNISKSLADIQESINLNPIDPTPYFFRALIYHGQKNRPKMLADLRKAADLSKAIGDINGYNSTTGFLNLLEKYGDQQK
jgi:Tfp pilus assembly protein PilF/V8-like Glu-specific endopeptidase